MAPNRGTTTITADVQGRASCTATLVNLGDAPQGGNVRVYVMDAQSGLPLAGVEVHLDYDGDGVHDGSPAPLVTHGGGLTESLVPPAGPYAVTAFLAGYTYLSVAGVEARDILLPLGPRPEPTITAGFSGRVDFRPYEQEVLGGQPGSLKLAIGGGTFRLESLLNFDLEPFLGPPPEGVCTDIPTPVDCYDIAIPGLPATVARLPLGVVLGLATQDIKSHFDVVSTPGRRLGWVLGGQVETAQLRDFIDLISTQLACTGDCPWSIGRAIDSIIPLLSRFAVGHGVGASLRGADLPTWNAHIREPYDDRRSSQLFPRYDDGELGRIVPSAPLHELVDYHVPDLPVDPTGVGPMEGMVVLTGVDVDGYGTVPLGVTTGVDCTEGDCFDRIGNAAAFDGIINGAQVCVTDPCPDGVPSTLPDGHVGLFHAAATGSLAGQRWITAFAALPISTVALPDTNVRATATIYWDAPAAVDPRSRPFPTFPEPPDQVTTRTYAMESQSSDAGVDFVTIEARLPEGEFRQRWVVYLPNDTTIFTAPPVPAGLDDPFAEPELSVAHVGLQLEAGTTFADLIRHDDTTLTDMLRRVIGVTFEQRDVPNP
jgi:hypothetical protein